MIHNYILFNDALFEKTGKISPPFMDGIMGDDRINPSIIGRFFIELGKEELKEIQHNHRNNSLSLGDREIGSDIKTHMYNFLGCIIEKVNNNTIIFQYTDVYLSDNTAILKKNIRESKIKLIGV